MTVLYEDNHIIVVSKPQGVASQPDESGDKDMLTMVKEYVKEKYNKDLLIKRVDDKQFMNENIFCN